MNKVWSLLGVVALMSGCAVGSDPSGDETTGLTKPGTTPEQSSEQANNDDSNPSGKADVVKEHTSEFNLAPQLIPGKPNRNGPIAPDPVVHVPAPAPAEATE